MREPVSCSSPQTISWCPQGAHLLPVSNVRVIWGLLGAKLCPPPQIHGLMSLPPAPQTVAALGGRAYEMSVKVK